MTSRTGSLTNFNGEPREEGLFFCLDMRGEPDALLGENGGALPTGNMEGNELTTAVLPLAEIPAMLMGFPGFALSIKVLTCGQAKHSIRNQPKQVQT